jgi:hypothetical protein
MPGMITAGTISGTMDKADILRGVLQQGIYLSNIVSVLDQVDVPNLTGTIPIYKSGGVDEDLGELETSGVKGGSFTNIEFNLKKDRAKLAKTDEAGFRSRAGDPLGIQITAAGKDLADKLDKKTAVALQTNPQTGAAVKKWSTSTNNILHDLTTASQACKPYRPDFVIMADDTFTAYCQNETLLKLSTGNPTVLSGALGRVPGLNLDIFTDSRITSGSAVVGASKYCGVLGKGPAKLGTTDDREHGATLYYADVWRQVKAPIYKKDDGTNNAVYQITALV